MGEFGGEAGWGDLANWRQKNTGGPAARGTKTIQVRLALPHDADERTEDLNVLVWLAGSRFGGAVWPLQPDAGPFLIELLQGHFAFHHGDDTLAVTGRFLPLDDDNVTVVDVVLNHGLAADLQGEVLITAKEVVEFKPF